MKKIILLVAVIVALCSENSFAVCRALEYTEIKDMTPNELQTELAKDQKYLNFTKKMLDLQWELRSAGGKNMREIDEYTKEATQCEDQITKIDRVIQKQKQDIGMNKPESK